MHPIWFNLFGYPIHLYAVMIATGFVVGIWLATRYAERVGYDRDLVLDLCWWILVAGLVGSRVLFIVVNWDQYYYPCVDVAYFNQLYPEDAITEPDCTRLLRFWNGGLVFLGGVIGAVLIIIWFMRRERLPVLPMTDVLIPSLAIGQFFGRLGCLAAGCCWGKPTGTDWGLAFPPRSMVFHQHTGEGLLNAGAAHSLPVHATQLYDSLVGLALFGVLLWIRQRKRYHGQVFVWWLLLYPLARSTIELFRGDDAERGFVFQVISEPLNQLLGLPAGSVTFLSTSQLISLCIVGGALVLRHYARRRATLTPAPADT